MGATIPHGGIVPVYPPEQDPRARRRTIPDELRTLMQDDTPYGKALARLIRDVFQPDAEVAEREEVFRRRLTDAVNQTAKAAFTPVTTVTYGGGDSVDSATPTVIPNLEQTIAVPIPARVNVILTVSVGLRVLAGDDKLYVEVVAPATACQQVLFVPSRSSMEGAILPVVASGYFDAIPGVVYTVTPRYYFEIGGINSFTSETFGTTLTTRVEARSLVRS